MKNIIKKYPYVLLVIGIILGLGIMFTFNKLTAFKMSNENKKEIKNNQNKQDEIVEQPNYDTPVKEDNIPKENNQTNNQNTLPPKKSETEVINYLKNEEQSFKKYTNENNLTFRQKAKATFVNCVDFIFYDKEIKGYKFSELTNSAKLAVLKIALSIDSKIDSYFPNYKEEIKGKYNEIKGKIVTKYLEITSKVCENNQSTCTQAREDFKNMKESFGITWDLIKDIAKDGGSALKEWYESYRAS